MGPNALQFKRLEIVSMQIIFFKKKPQLAVKNFHANN